VNRKVLEARSGTTVAIKQINSPFDSVATAACALKQLRIFSTVHHPNVSDLVVIAVAWSRATQAVPEKW
jgi:hypothetical protein